VLNVWILIQNHRISYRYDDPFIHERKMSTQHDWMRDYDGAAQFLVYHISPDYMLYRHGYSRLRNRQFIGQ